MSLSVDIEKRLSSSFILAAKFSVPPGIAIVFGASGSGKTTLLRCIAGLLRPDTGSIQIGDRTLFDSARRIDAAVPERNVGYVLQNLALFPHMSIAANVEYGISALDAPSRRQRVAEILETFRIAHLLDRKPSEISGGERQRVALARTLITNPYLLMLDEPLSSLDRLTQSRIIEDLRAWNAAHGIPILYVTHSQREAFALGERVIVLENGNVLAQGSPQEVLESPTQEPLAQLLGFENIFDATVISINSDSGTMHCRIVDTDTQLETPLARLAPGSALRIAIRAGDILLATEQPRGLSARNILPGRLTYLRRESATIIATIAAGDAGATFEVHITPSASETLNLKKDQQLWLVIKTHSCRVLAK